MKTRAGSPGGGMKGYNHVELALPVCPSSKGAKVVLNGVPLEDVRAVSVKSGFDEVTEVTITLIAHVNHPPAD